MAFGRSRRAVIPWSRKADGGHRSSIPQVEGLWNTADMIGVRDGELRIEAALPVAELIRVDPVTDTEAAQLPPSPR